MLFRSRVKVWDASVSDPEMEEKADVLYLDLPCSGLGILGKKRDIKYHVTKESLEDLVRLQRRIMETCFRYVKPGGVILYSTCTVHRAENEEQVRWICKNIWVISLPLWKQVSAVPRSAISFIHFVAESTMMSAPQSKGLHR